mmetsp:Transcript_12126/g.24831  ORF Transcript_12126/g.24831 Transcript_12126/m.24831 type:complete len:355 (-) Transcript_12126:458-1522(-)
MRASPSGMMREMPMLQVVVWRSMTMSARGAGLVSSSPSSSGTTELPSTSWDEEDDKVLDSARILGPNKASISLALKASWGNEAPSIKFRSSSVEQNSVATSQEDADAASSFPFPSRTAATLLSLSMLNSRLRSASTNRLFCMCATGLARRVSTSSDGKEAKTLTGWAGSPWDDGDEEDDDDVPSKSSRCLSMDLMHHTPVYSLPCVPPTTTTFLTGRENGETVAMGAWGYCLCFGLACCCCCCRCCCCCCCCCCCSRCCSASPPPRIVIITGAERLLQMDRLDEIPKGNDDADDDDRRRDEPKDPTLELLEDADAANARGIKLPPPPPRAQLGSAVASNEMAAAPKTKGWRRWR